MPVLLKDETWARIEKMLEDYESGVLRVIPVNGLKVIEQITTKANCPGTKIGIDPNDPNGFLILTLDVCVNGNSETHEFLVKS